MAETPSRTLSLQDRLYLLLLRLICLLPLRRLQAIGRFLGLMMSQSRQTTPVFVARRNLELCFPEKSPAWHASTARQSIVSNAMTILEFAKCWGSSPAYSLSQVHDIHNEPILTRAIAGNKGTIALLPHFGTWEFMNTWTNQRTHTTVMYKPSKSAAVDQFVLEARSRLSATLVPTNEGGVRALLKGLKQNSFVAVLPDHVPQENGGIMAPFFGVSTLSSVLVSKLWQKTGCAVIVMYCLRRPNGDGFDIYIEEPHPDFFSDDLTTSVTGMNKTMEQVILKAPEQYQWAYKRFKDCEHISNVYNQKSPPRFAIAHPAQALYKDTAQTSC